METKEHNLKSDDPLRKMRNAISVFLVDDDKTYLATLEYYLNQQLQSKIKIEPFINGEDCLKEIETNPTTEIVILDYYLNTELSNSMNSEVAMQDYYLNPESSNTMNGLEVLKKIKEINPEIIVIMLSAEDKLEIAIDCITYGAYEYVVKSETAFIRTQNILKNLIHAVALQPYYPPDIGGES